MVELASQGLLWCLQLIAQPVKFPNGRTKLLVQRSLLLSALIHTWTMIATMGQTVCLCNSEYLLSCCQDYCCYSGKQSHHTILHLCLDHHQLVFGSFETWLQLILFYLWVSRSVLCLLFPTSSSSSRMSAMLYSQRSASEGRLASNSFCWRTKWATSRSNSGRPAKALSSRNASWSTSWRYDSASRRTAVRYLPPLNCRKSCRTTWTSNN